MNMVTLDYSQSDNAPIQIDLHVETTIQISAKDARHIVNRHILSELSTGLTAEIPELFFQNGQILWRVPILLSLPFSGDIGLVGTLSVDAQNGKLLTSPEQDQQILQYANHLNAGRFDGLKSITR